MSPRLKRYSCFTVALCMLVVVTACNLIVNSDHSTDLSTSSAYPGNRKCLDVGKWWNPVTRNDIATTELLSLLASRSAVLLGESHASAEDHRWQLHTISALFAHNPDMVIGFEMFPRSTQFVLNQWVRGELDVQTFLKKVKWEENWRYDPSLYLPLFYFARQNHVPMIALNVDRSLVQRVADQGWAEIPIGEREGVSDPAPGTAAYRRELAFVYLIKRQHGEENHQTEHTTHEYSEEEIEAVLEEPKFKRFVQAQLTWDRAMAEGLISGKRAHNASIAVGIMGRGHVEFGHGVAHQLADLGVAEAATAVTTTPVQDCNEITFGVANAVFVVPEDEESVSARPILGVHISGSEAGVRVESVVSNSVAMAAGVIEGDLIIAAAGRDVHEGQELVKIVRRQAPGTWLPLAIKRGDVTMEIVAKFPVAFDYPKDPSPDNGPHK